MEQKHLYRSRKNRMVAGVCGGIAEYFNVDPVLVRLIAVLFLLAGVVPGFLLYVVAWIIIPEASETNGTDFSPPNE